MRPSHLQPLLRHGMQCRAFAVPLGDAFAEAIHNAELHARASKCSKPEMARWIVETNVVL